MKINRLLEITILLLNRRSVTAKELASRFGVSVRTIYRDIDILSCAGVPVYTTRGSGGGISLLEDYSLTKTFISERECESMLLALKTLQATQFPEIDAVLDKIGMLFRNTDVYDWVYIDFSPWGSRPDEEQKFQTIKQSILKRRIISFDYISSLGERSCRQIEPLRLMFKAHAWYLWGFCKTRNDFRLFRISRMKDVILTADTFVRKINSPVAQNDGDDKQVPLLRVILKFYPPMLYRIYDDFDDSLITKCDDGTSIVEVTFPEDDWVYGYLLSFGSSVEVLEPGYIRSALADKMRNALQFYERTSRI